MRITNIKDMIARQETKGGAYTAPDMVDALRRVNVTPEEAPAVLVPSISKGNSKTGAIASFSTLPVLTCAPGCSQNCGRWCYARALANFRANMRDCWARNTVLMSTERGRAVCYAAIEKIIVNARAFRWNVGGDIIDLQDLRERVKLARNNPHCTFLQFTTRWDLISCLREIPENFRIVLSSGTIHNPEEAMRAALAALRFFVPCVRSFVHPRDKEAAPLAAAMRAAGVPAKPCGGNCTDCLNTGAGCWAAGAGDVILFKAHGTRAGAV